MRCGPVWKAIFLNAHMKCWWIEKLIWFHPCPKISFKSKGHRGGEVTQSVMVRSAWQVKIILEFIWISFGLAVLRIILQNQNGFSLILRVVFLTNEWCTRLFAMFPLWLCTTSGLSQSTWVACTRTRMHWAQRNAGGRRVYSHSIHAAALGGL